MHINECVEIIRVSVVQSLECKVTNPKVQNSKQGQEQKCSTKKNCQRRPHGESREPLKLTY